LLQPLFWEYKFMQPKALQ